MPGIGLEISSKLRGLRVAFALGLVILAACSREPPPQDAVVSFGHAPDRNGSTQYQQDVVFLPGGPTAIRSASADGLTFRIDPAAGRQLAIGKIMFAGSRSVGRVIRLESRNDGLKVILAPVAFTDVVREAAIKSIATFRSATS
jgi:hypothetical protein